MNSRQKKIKIEAKKICLIRTSALGDTVHALGLVNGLRKGYPDAHLTWILQPLPYEMVKFQKNIDRFIIYDRNQGVAGWLNLMKQLRKESFDLLLIPHVSAKASAIALCVRARIKIGFDFKRSREFHWLAANRHIPHHPMGHVQDQFFEFLDFLGITDYPVEWNFEFNREELAWRESFFQNIKRPAVSFVISSSNAEKDWHPEGYAAVMDHADHALGLQPMIIGGPSAAEHIAAQKISELCRSKPIIALEKPIRHTMLQISGSRLVVSPDTGPLHMAVAFNVPTIGLYGYTNPRRCGPYRKYRDLLIDRFNDPGEENAPITRENRSGRVQMITPEMVISKIELGLKNYPVV
ncbi:MAG: glycosyltransferase family 9 protein [Desulfobacterales bacterium]|nr:glycosyltransferase family 9 protein [Desulfobacterales bacterium]